MGEYYVPVKKKVFLPETRNENEHSAADAFRKGVRVGFINEVGTVPWYPPLLSPDPTAAAVALTEWVPKAPRRSDQGLAAAIPPGSPNINRLC